MEQESRAIWSVHLVIKPQQLQPEYAILQGHNSPFASMKVFLFHSGSNSSMAWSTLFPDRMYDPPKIKVMQMFIIKNKANSMIKLTKFLFTLSAKTIEDFNTNYIYLNPHGFCQVFPTARTSVGGIRQELRISCSSTFLA